LTRRDKSRRNERDVITYRTTSSISLLPTIQVALALLNIHRHIGAIEFTTGDVMGILNPWKFPPLFFEVFELVARMEDWRALLVIIIVIK
jgi:hypothetical protein